MLTVSWVSFFDNEIRVPKPFMKRFQFLGAPGFPRANRRRMTIYYIIITIENAVMYGVWIYYQAEGVSALQKVIVDFFFEILWTP